MTPAAVRSVELNLRAHCVEPSRVVALFWHRHRHQTPALDAVRSAARTATAAELLLSTSDPRFRALSRETIEVSRAAGGRP
jgi:hypothetical protein